ncbi:MAG: hypothetical protein IJP92_10500, partial [Lachnospiraceae bacterium]|nr:hypothetical protein [Lachnospiraceae bacterium]
DITVTSDGKVWKTDGGKYSVVRDGITSSLEGSYSYHNHPADETHWSFGEMDSAEFISTKSARLEASDDKYVYWMQRTENTVEKTYAEVYNEFRQIHRYEVLQMQADGVIPPDDDYHATMEILSERLGFEYGRRSK